MRFLCRPICGLALILIAFYLPVAKAMPPKQTELILTTAISSHERLWTVSPQVLSPIEQVLRYEIATEKTGQSGRSQTRQSGQVNVTPHHPTTLATLTLGLAPEDSCVVSVQVFAGTELLAKEQIKLPQ